MPAHGLAVTPHWEDDGRSDLFGGARISTSESVDRTPHHGLRGWCGIQPLLGRRVRCGDFFPRTGSVTEVLDVCGGDQRHLLVVRANRRLLVGREFQFTPRIDNAPVRDLGCVLGARISNRSGRILKKGR